MVAPIFRARLRFGRVGRDMTRYHIIRGDITQVRVMAIVNAANEICAAAAVLMERYIRRRAASCRMSAMRWAAVRLGKRD